jgi:hypothetical protein
VVEPKLHLDMDASRRDLYEGLLAKGHDVTRTPNLDVPQNASDEYQLLWATSHQRVLFTFNVRDFMLIAKKHPYHAGIILANQRTTRLTVLIANLDRALSNTKAEDWTGQIHWISEWNR